MRDMTPERVGYIIAHASCDDTTADGSHSLDYAADLMDEYEFTDDERTALYVLAEGVARADRTSLQSKEIDDDKLIPH